MQTFKPIEVTRVPYSPGVLGFNNVMRGAYAPWILLCIFIGVTGFLWQQVIGFPNWAEDGAMMSGSAGFIRAADPLLWWISLVVMAATIGSMLLANVLYFAACGTVPKNPRSNIYGIMFYAIAAGAFLLSLLIQILAY